MDDAGAGTGAGAMTISASAEAATGSATGGAICAISFASSCVVVGVSFSEMDASSSLLSLFVESSMSVSLGATSGSVAEPVVVPSLARASSNRVTRSFLTPLVDNPRAVSSALSSVTLSELGSIIVPVAVVVDVVLLFGKMSMGELRVMYERWNKEKEAKCAGIESIFMR